YGAFGLTPEPFSNFRVFAPFRPQMEPGSGQGEQGKRVPLAPLGGGQGRLRLNTYRNGPMASGCVFPIAWTIGDFLWMPHRVFDRADLDDKLFGLVDELRHLKPASLDEAIGLLDEGIKESEIHPQGTWNGHHRSTIIKLKNRLRGLKSKFGGLLCDVALDFSGANKVDDSFTDQELRVVDIAHCNTNVQEVLVTAVIHEIWKKAELGTLGVDKLIVFVDELNKYAPAGGEGALRDILVDIAARGRHLNVVLFGAQQFRSKVDGEILGNCGTAFYGRVGDEEIVNAAYRSLSETVKSELLGLPKGRLLVRHAHFRAPLFGIFPMPPTVTGTVGQKVYNGDGALTTQHPGDPLWMLLTRLMGAKAPQKNEVRRACEGCDPGAVLTIGQKIESMAARATHERFDPWRTAQGQLRLLRTQGGGGAPF
ncbi:MAG: ATP-binding protein, partial [Thermomicrobiales bacterium]|nr:ATP-binding protein [Thermomicrobiales bacterium]